MPYRNSLRLSLWLVSFALLLGCRTTNHLQAPELLTYFKFQPSFDTLHIEIADENPESGDTIPNRLFFNSIPPVLLEQIDYLIDSSASIIIARKQFLLNDTISACWVDFSLSWFRHHSLFLYNRSKRQFTDRITVAEWFGGDGGQVLTGSWVFDYNGDGKKDIVRRDIQHGMTLNGDEPVEHTFESATLLLWGKGHFIDTPFQDTAALIRRFPIQSYWR